ILARRYPVLIQGPTASGKTSIIQYLATVTGHRFIRINNHEHTDLQEYLGSYISDADSGKLKFQEGLLVQALRNGDWLVLDELNLAPTDVLEALNRLLDDNRELLIPETQEIVRPHPHFMLFATQNPPGLYGGRKVLSRAFRNRFLEFHFDEVPQHELVEILKKSCDVPPTAAKQMVEVFVELQRRRQMARVFEQKHSFATLRDLFRWAQREQQTPQNWAEHGFMLIGERARSIEDAEVIRTVIEDVMKVKIDREHLYTVQRANEVITLSALPTQLAWTPAMRRLYILVANAVQRDEPVLLVGETGTGKTSLCQAIARALGRNLRIVGCHMNSETADFLGSHRPVRNRESFEQIRTAIASFITETGLDPSNDLSSADRCITFIETILHDTTLSPEGREMAIQLKHRLHRAVALFEWHDGPLVQAMKEGDLLLLDEISLADDSVLERLNSVLEPSRSMTVTEMGGDDFSHLHVVASPGFNILATMNPGGDYGKKELSPALRNRFTEIWVPSMSDTEDFLEVMQARSSNEDISAYSTAILSFFRWFETEYAFSQKAFGLRDALAWIDFMKATKSSLGLPLSFVHGCLLICVDALPASVSDEATLSCIRKASSMVDSSNIEIEATPSVVSSSDYFQVGPFRVVKGRDDTLVSQFSFVAPTARSNTLKLLRALQISKPVLLEGDPGVGKTSLVLALAAACGYEAIRINLSDQTDLSDLFGSDLPTEGGGFSWKDAPFLTAMKNGNWVLLDEMNLAPQTVLEGLNSCLDHRGEVYIPELDRNFRKHPQFRIFATQNPLVQGGGRKGLPKSYLNRFTSITLQALTEHDTVAILS
ncbi:P-loop containing nucleoside triphosphate hydrolase protein, partial [Atractiella rhizophila]